MLIAGRALQCCKAGVITGDVAWNLLKFAKAKGFVRPLTPVSQARTGAGLKEDLDLEQLFRGVV